MSWNITDALASSLPPGPQGPQGPQGPSGPNANAAYAQANSAYAEANLKLNLAGGTVTGSLNVNQNLSVLGNISVNGHLTIGNQTTDTVNVVADFSSNLIPDVTQQFNLGSAEKEWKEVYAQRANVNGNLIVSGTTITRNIIPDANVTYTIGTPNNRFKDIYLANSTIYLGDAILSANGKEIVITDNSGNVIVLNAASQTVNTGNVVANVIVSGPTETTYNVFTTNADVPITIDSFPSPSFTTVKYIIQSKSIDGYHSTELFCMQDGISSYLTEYATLINNYTLGSYSLTVSGGVCNLIFHPNNPMNNIITVKLVRTALNA